MILFVKKVEVVSEEQMLGDLTKNQVRNYRFQAHVLKPGAHRIVLSEFSSNQVFSDSKHEKAVRGRLKSEVGA